MTRLARISEFADDLTAIRQDIHAHPEIGFEEVRTSDLVAKYLTDLGIQVYRGIGKTGVVGVLEGNGPGRTIGLRADMDALPILEKTNLPWASTHTGVMHACGHDSHTAMLMGAARYLAGARDFAGQVVFIFQPAEEGQGGARAMIAEGLFDRFPCDEIYALHNQPTGRLGEVKVKFGAAYAGADFFDVKIEGRGAHAAYPHQGSDTIAAAGALIQSFHTIVSRSVAPSERAVLSITKMAGGAAYNVLPDEVTVGGTIRFCSDETADLMRRRMDELARGVGASFDVTVTIDRQQVFSVLENDAACARAAIAAASAVVGADRVEGVEGPGLGSEDFADMLKIIPGAYLTIGHGGTMPLHNPGFVLDDNVLPLGAAIFCEIVARRSGADDGLDL